MAMSFPSSFTMEDRFRGYAVVVHSTFLSCATVVAGMPSSMRLDRETCSNVRLCSSSPVPPSMQHVSLITHVEAMASGKGIGLWCTTVCP